MMTRAWLTSLMVCTAACGSGARDTVPGTDGSIVHADSELGTGDAPPTPEVSLIYAHSGTELYRVDSTTFEPVALGTLTGIGTQSLTDLAVDKTGKVVGVTLNKLYSIDPTTGACTLIKALSGSGLTSLSYIPADLTDPASADILVTADDQGDVYSIDPATGTMTKIGSYGSIGGKKIISSGDLFGVRGVGIFATVNIAGETNDFLAQISDQTTWAATPIGAVTGGGTGFANIFGLGYWAGTIYGFDKQNQIVEINATTGVGTMKNSGAISWFGAGVTTDAPIIE